MLSERETVEPPWLRTVVCVAEAANRVYLGVRCVALRGRGSGGGGAAGGWLALLLEAGLRLRLRLGFRVHRRQQLTARRRRRRRQRQLRLLSSLGGRRGRASLARGGTLPFGGLPLPELGKQEHHLDATTAHAVSARAAGVVLWTLGLAAEQGRAGRSGAGFSPLGSRSSSETPLRGRTHTLALGFARRHQTPSRIGASAYTTSHLTAGHVRESSWRAPRLQANADASPRVTFAQTSRARPPAPLTEYTGWARPPSPTGRQSTGFESIRARTG
jgi:hypothetical protein